MGVNKVVYNGKNGAETLIDLTGDSVTPETLAVGATAHDASGNKIEGILSPKDGEDGVGISNVTINSSGHLVLTYTDGNVVDVGKVVGDKGELGYYVKATVDRPSFTESSWATYGTAGREENWGNTSNSGFRVGDLFFVVGTSTDEGKGHLLVYKYTGVKGGSTLSGVCLGHHIISARGAKGEDGKNATTTEAATESNAGLMSADDKKKLNGIADGANAYLLPTASNTLGGVKTTSDVTDVSGYTPCPISEGVPYYKDTNNTYSNATLGQGYATCSTAAATTAKVASLSGYAAAPGGIISVKFSHAVPAGATLNINGRGAKQIYYKGKAIVAGVINADEVATFVYDGQRYHLLTVDRNRFFTSLVPYGTAIVSSDSAPVDLNTAAYMKVGNYFCASNANAAGLTNVPIAKKAFMMQVYSPLSTTVDNETGTWVYRIRKLMHYTGEEYTQYCYTNGTAGNWIYGPWNKTVITSDIPIATTSSNGLMSAADKVKLNSAVEYVEYGYTIDVGTIIAIGGELSICPGGEMVYVYDSDHVQVCMADLIDAVRAICDELGISAFSSSYSLRRNRSATETYEPSGEAVEPIEEAVEASGETESSEK